MCTIGAVKLSEDEIVLFKNKDFADPTFSDEVVLSEHHFGAKGLETFDAAGAESVFSGLSVGANRYGLLACVNHVKTTGNEALNYDILVQEVIENAQSVDEAIQCVQKAIDIQPYWWGNLVIADTEQLAVIEVRGKECQVRIDYESVFRTNHQPMYSEHQSPDNIRCSAARFESAEQRLAHVVCLEDVFELLSTHDNVGEKSGICNHTDTLSTVYSYVLHRVRNQTRLYVTKGNPCSNKWRSLDLPLGEDWSSKNASAFLEQYPN